MFLCSGPIVIVVLGGASDGSVTRKFWEIFYWTRLFFQFHGESYSGDMHYDQKLPFGGCIRLTTLEATAN
jgi:hypothetical protein